MRKTRKGKEVGVKGNVGGGSGVGGGEGGESRLMVMDVNGIY